MVYYTGLLFSLRSGVEHRSLRFRPSLFEPSNERAYLRYTEDVSKTNHGGLKARKRETKVVTHYQNVDNPKRCFISLYKLYMSVCPKVRPDNVFYLKPLSKPQGECWFSSVPIGHNMLQNMVPNLLKSVGVTGYYTNHSLKATTATRLFEAGVDKQLIMQRIGDSSSAVRSYKRIGKKLRPLTSDILNKTISAIDVDKKDSIEKEEKEK